ncbi:PadR family transcriptional regulator [Bhargavaea ullalensis]|uniref:DNA-binding PadR family transcriptional regulator n=1 Tax=Bhargavaea ullalensis TaxID=1265685 RepID=A0ABV2GDR0_9BACL
MEKEMLKGSIDLILLSLLRREDLYGYEIVQLVHELSGGAYEMSEGTLYAALKRIERKNWVESYWVDGSGQRRKYYRLTDKGGEAVNEKMESWNQVDSLIRKTAEGLQ